MLWAKLARHKPWLVQHIDPLKFLEKFWTPEQTYWEGKKTMFLRSDGSMQGDLGSLHPSWGNMADGKFMVKVLESNLCTDSGLPLIGSVSSGEGDLFGAWRLHPGVAYKILDCLVKLRVIFFQSQVPLHSFLPFAFCTKYLDFGCHNENILKSFRTFSYFCLLCVRLPTVCVVICASLCIRCVVICSKIQLFYPPPPTSKTNVHDEHQQCRPRGELCLTALPSAASFVCLERKRIT